MDIKKNALLTVKIHNLSYGGRGIGKYNGVVVFVPRTVPGDTVSARVVKRKANYISAELVEVLESSPLRIKPKCDLFGICGGCSWQNIPYEDQLVFKEEIARTTLEHIGRQQDFTLHPIIASPKKWRYRNKADYTFGLDEKGEAVLGFHKPGSYFEILDVGSCHLQPSEFDVLVNEMRQFTRENNLEPYNPKTHEGNLRHFTLRYAEGNGAESTGSVLAILLTVEEDLPGTEDLVERLRKKCPGLKGFIHGLNRGKSDVARMEQRLFQWGDDFLIDTLGELKVRVSAPSFFQTNTRAAELLYEQTRGFLSLSGKEILIDAYCGTGTIGLYCAGEAGRVYGIEVLREAVWDARFNADMNRIDNCIFLCGEFRKSVPLLMDRLPCGFQRVVVDPPRSGLDKKSLRKIIELQAPVMVYVSCNPSTLARDAKLMCDAGYHITDLQPVDMFPHTFHIELVARFEKPVKPV